MLDKSKLIAQLHKVSDQLFVENDGLYDYVQGIWKVVIADPLFLHKVKEVSDAPWPIPLWEGELGYMYDISKISEPHIVLSVDGSQIYPDRHNVSPCFLINTGSVILPYAVPHQSVQFYSNPTVFVSFNDSEIPFTVDMVNGKRQEFEMQEGLALAQRIKNERHNGNDGVNSVLLFDGSLIFWHLSSKEKDIKDMFLQSYCSLLLELYHEKIATAWYISSPKSKELVNLLRLYLCDFDPNKKYAYESINRVIDATIMSFFLPECMRTIVFKNCSSISDYYPPSVRPFFFYLNTGNEIGRVEIPAWIAHDQEKVDFIAAVVIDQCVKGGGYPVALAEAHEQAVIKGPDREFFYHYLQKMTMERGRRVGVSCKSLKKRGIGI